MADKWGVIDAPEKGTAKGAATTTGRWDLSADATEPKISAEERPDIVGRTKAALTKEPPLGAHTMFGETDTPGRVVRALGDLILPGSVSDAAAFAATLPIGGSVLSAPLKRAGASALAGGGARYAQTGDITDAAKTGAYQAGSQLVGETLPGALRFGLTQRSGNRALTGRAAELGQRGISEGAEAKVRADKIEHDTTFDKALRSLEAENYTKDVAARRTSEASKVRDARADYRDQKAQRERAFKEQEEGKQAAFKRETEAAKTAHATAKREYAESGATTIAESYRGMVPAWKEIPATEAGLVDMISGSGPQRLSERFDQSMKSAVEQGKGKLLEVRLEDAQALGMRLPKVMKGEGGRPVALVPADQAAELITGYWKKDPGVYRRVVAALDSKGIGDPVARGEYRAGRSLIDFGMKSKMIKPEGSAYHFNPEAARKAFTDQKVEQLRRRNMGNINEGPIAGAVNRPEPQLTLPAEPTPGTPPVTPSFRRPAASPENPTPPRRAIVEPPELPTRQPLSPTPEGVTSKTLPNVPWYVGASIAEIPAILSGIAQGHYHGFYGVPGIAGGLAAHGLSGRRIFTEAPISPASRFATQVLPTLEAQETRNLVEGRRR